MNDEDKTPEQHVLDIQKACSYLNWVIAMNDEDTGVKGLIIGNEKFVQEILEQLNNTNEFEFWTRPDFH